MTVSQEETENTMGSDERLNWPSLPAPVTCVEEQAKIIKCRLEEPFKKEDTWLVCPFSAVAFRWCISRTF